MGSRFLSRLARRLRLPRGFRLTASGRVFFVLLFAVIVISLATGNNLLYLALASMLAFMVVSGVQSEANLRHIELERLLPPDIHAGRPARMGYALRNVRTTSVRLVLADLSEVRIPAIRRSDTVVVHADVTFARRGRAELGDITVYTSYPYGLFVKSVRFPASRRIVVFPRPVGVHPAAAAGENGEGKGAAMDAVSHVRPYVYGDPVSQVAWKKHRAGLVTRVFEGGAGAGGVVVLTPGGDVEAKLSHATHMILELHRARVPFGLLVGSNFSGLDSTAGHKTEVLTTLALAEEIPAPNCEVLPRDARAIIL